eukprot:4825025-Prymnesium_polylepis.2
MDADAISRADEKGDGADAFYTFHVVCNDAEDSWILVVPLEQPAVGAADLTEQLSDGSHRWERPAWSPRARRAASSRSAARWRRGAFTRSRTEMKIGACHR